MMVKNWKPLNTLWVSRLIEITRIASSTISTESVAWVFFGIFEKPEIFADRHRFREYNISLPKSSVICEKVMKCIFSFHDQKSNLTYLFKCSDWYLPGFDQILRYFDPLFCETICNLWRMIKWNLKATSIQLQLYTQRNNSSFPK